MSMPEELLLGGNGGAIQPNTLMPTLPGAPQLPVAQAPELPGMLPTMDVAPTPPNPWQTLGRMLQGFGAGAQGQPNPMITQELAQQRLELQAKEQKIQAQQLDRLIKKDEAATKHQAEQFAVTTALKLIEDPSPDNREWGYRMLQQHGGLAPSADPAKMSLVGKLDYKRLRDDAIDFIENGLDPATMGEAFQSLPLEQWKKMHAENPFALNQLRESKRSQDDVVKAFLLRVRQMPKEQLERDPNIQRHIAAAESVLGAGKMPDYGAAVNTALGQIPNPATPGYGWNPKTQAIPQEVLAQAGEKAQYGSGPPTVDRDLAEIADLEAKLQNPKSAEEYKTNQAKRDAKLAEMRSKQRAKLELQRFSRLDIEALVDKDYKRGTPEWNTAYANLANMSPLQQGGSMVGAGNIAAGLGPQGTGMGAGAQPTPPIALGPVPPVAEGTVKDLMSAGRVRRAAVEVAVSLRDPVVEGYIGPYAQHWADIQRAAPKEWLGKIPPPVVRLQQNLSTVNNYTIKLITGAQMGEREADRIKSEMPSLGNQRDEFTQRLTQTLENQKFMENQILDLALRGDQRAKALASELGLRPQGGMQLDRPAMPEGSKRIREIGGKQRTGTLAPNVPVPSGWEEVK